MSIRILPQAGMSTLMRFSAQRCSLCDVILCFLMQTETVITNSNNAVFCEI